MKKRLPLNQIIQEDCIRFLRTLPDNCIDLIITDPPYGDNVAYGWHNKKIRNNENPLMCCQALAECYRILRKNSSLYVFTNWKNYPFLIEFVIRYTKFKIRHLIVWKKHNFGFGWVFRHQYELILVLEKGKPAYNLKNFSDVQTCNHINHNKENHPHEKPIDLIERMIEHSSKKKDLILDPFCGSGSVCVACKKSNRNFIGVEIEGKYVNMARKRFT